MQRNFFLLIAVTGYIVSCFVALANPTAALVVGAIATVPMLTYAVALGVTIGITDAAAAAEDVEEGHRMSDALLRSRAAVPDDASSTNAP